ncbi:YciI family protein [Streptomyces polygonati]|uniref:YciI family protein n=1 Tax=Streptomyces polygonati TaxID=1617087 RepID=A0ABV8HL15_9ACTN
MDDTMRYMVLLKLDPAANPAEPSAELMEEMGKLLEEMTRGGVMLDTGGLRPVEDGTVLRLSGGKQTVVDGPYAEAKEVIGGYCMLQAKSQEEAVEWASRFLAIHGDAWELSAEVRQVVEAE